MTNDEVLREANAFVESWFPHFVKHAQSRGIELLEILSDCSREVLLNSHTAHHMRIFGRQQRYDLFWARCEWDRTDIAFGKAKQRFDARKWNDEWGKKTTGDLGIIEAKVVYRECTAEAYVKRIVAQLKDAEKRCARSIGLKLGMVWWFSFENGDPNDKFREMMPKHGFVPIGPGFSKIAEGDTRTMWPIEPSGVARLDVGLFRWGGVKA